MKLAQVLAFASTMTAFAKGYSFSDKLDTPETKKESTGLTANEENRIYGGTEVNVDDFPFAVNLRIDFFDSSYCGGALIAPQWVLTSGYCIRTDEYDITAVLGSSDRDGTKGEHIKVVKGYRHPGYVKNKHLNDIGLLKLAKPSKQKTIKRCAEDGSDNEVGTMATIVGWGMTEKGEESKKLLGVEIPIVSNAECNKSYRNRIKEGMMCAGKGNGKDSCNGDYGGPLVANDILVGIASWGGKCGKHPGVYTRLTYVMDYIDDILNGGDGSSFAVSSSTSGSSSHEISFPEFAAGSTNSSSTDASVEGSSSGSLSFDFGFESTSSSADSAYQSTATKQKSTGDATQSTASTPANTATKTNAAATKSSAQKSTETVESDSAA